MIFNLLFTVLGVGTLLVLLYLTFLAVVSLWPQKKEKLLAPKNKFAIVIPAHNEDELLGQTLDILKKNDYPPSLYEVVVIADNCDDSTSEIATARDMTCMCRYDPDNRGKGAALSWAFPRILVQGNHTAYVVIDADTHMETDFLAIINHHFLQGAKAVQGYSQVRHPERSPMESLAFLGFALNRNLRYHGRSRLGLTTNLMGTGMCFKREIIEQYGWNTTSMVEDIEYSMYLHLQNIHVTFARDAHVSVKLHNKLNQSQGQRTRWDMGKFEIRNRYLPKLIKKGFSKRDLSYFDSALELLLPPFSLFFLLVLLFFFLLFCSQKRDLTYFIWLTNFFILILYTCVGLITAGADLRTYRSLFYAPLFLVWRAWIIILESCKKQQQPRQW